VPKTARTADEKDGKVMVFDAGIKRSRPLLHKGDPESQQERHGPSLSNSSRLPGAEGGRDQIKSHEAVTRGIAEKQKYNRESALQVGA